jgi:hypothetical protein
MSRRGCQVLNLANTPAGIDTPEDFTVTAIGTTTTIQFAANTIGSAWSVDSVSVTDVTPASTSEPASLALIAAGFLGMEAVLSSIVR